LFSLVEAVRNAYFFNDEEKFDVFWSMEARISIGNQKRAQTSRTKKKTG